MTAYQNLRMIERYEKKINWSLYDEATNEKYSKLVEKHVAEYINKTGKFPEPRKGW